MKYIVHYSTHSHGPLNQGPSAVQEEASSTCQPVQSVQHQTVQTALPDEITEKKGFNTAHITGVTLHPTHYWCIQLYRIN